MYKYGKSSRSGKYTGTAAIEFFILKIMDLNFALCIVYCILCFELLSFDDKVIVNYQWSIVVCLVGSLLSLAYQ